MEDYDNKNRFWTGFFLIPLGPIGLILGLRAFDKKTYARKTFLKGMFGPMLVILLICLIAGLVAGIGALIEKTL